MGEITVKHIKIEYRNDSGGIGYRDFTTVEDFLRWLEDHNALQWPYVNMNEYSEGGNSGIEGAY